MGSIAVELLVLKQGQVVHTVPMSGGVLFIGRNPDNDLALSSPGVSGRHAVLHLSEDGQAVILRDLGSTNGTFLDERPVQGAVPVADGQRVRLGASVELRVHTTEVPGPGSRVRPTLLADLDTGIAYPIHSERIYVGSGQHCQVRVPDLPHEAACLTLHPDGMIWVGTNEREFPAVVGEPLLIEGHRLVFRHARSALEATAKEEPTAVFSSIELEIRLLGGDGPQAIIRDSSTRRTCELRAENRVSLLYVLAARLRDDLAAGVPRPDAGWCADEEVMSGVWGRSWGRMDTNNYQVLIFRTRKELKRAGLDGWLIEKRRGQTRLRAHTVSLS